jgi:hypothetical protein
MFKFLRFWNRKQIYTRRRIFRFFPLDFLAFFLVCAHWYTSFHKIKCVNKHCQQYKYTVYSIHIYYKSIICISVDVESAGVGTAEATHIQYLRTKRNNNIDPSSWHTPTQPCPRPLRAVHQALLGLFAGSLRTVHQASWGFPGLFIRPLSLFVRLNYM